MKEVLRRSRAENPDSTQMLQMIMDIASLNNLAGEFMASGGRTPQVNLVQSTAVKKTKSDCDKCGRDNHATENCRIPVKDLKCEHHGSTGSHMTAACRDKKRGSRPPSPSSAGSKSGSPNRTRSRTRSPKFGRGTPRHAYQYFEILFIQFPANRGCLLEKSKSAICPNL